MPVYNPPFRTLQEAYDDSSSPQITGDLGLVGNLDVDGDYYKNNNLFIHEYDAGNNGTVTVDGNNLFVGQGSGNQTMGATATSTFESSGNVGLGGFTLVNNTLGYQNTGVGFGALQNNTEGFANFGLGYGALNSNTTGDFNSAMGSESLNSNSTGKENLAAGYRALRNNTTGNRNVAMGYQALLDNLTGIGNVVAGRRSGRDILGDYNVCLGYEAGRNETGSNKLYIANSNTSDPLIYGDFSTSELKVNGSFEFTNGLIKQPTRVTTTYTILVTDETIFGNTDSAAFTATLPAGVEGQTFRIVNTGTSGNDLTLAPNGSEHLLGVNSNFTLRDGESLILTYNSTDGWY